LFFRQPVFDYQHLGFGFPCLNTQRNLFLWLFWWLRYPLQLKQLSSSTLLEREEQRPLMMHILLYPRLLILDLLRHGQRMIGNRILGRGLTCLDLQELVALEVAIPVLVRGCDIGHDLAVFFVGWVGDFNFELLGLANN